MVGKHNVRSRRGQAWRDAHVVQSQRLPLASRGSKGGRSARGLEGSEMLCSQRGSTTGGSWRALRSRRRSRISRYSYVMQSKRYPWGKDICFLAACGGHLVVLKWCVANGCQWESEMGDIDIHVGGSNNPFKLNLGIMVWAVPNGCPWMSLGQGFCRVMRLAVTSEISSYSSGVPAEAPCSPLTSCRLQR